MIAPNSTVRLLTGVRLDSEYQNTRMFASASEQASYFNSKALLTFEQCTYLREDHIIKVEAPVDAIYLCNYIMYRNINHSSKWFYAFVNKIDYVNDRVSALHIQMDIMQTWMFEVQWLPSFIEREHCTEFVSGKPVINTVEEGLDFGDDNDIVSMERYYPYGNVKFMMFTSTIALHMLEDDPMKNTGSFVSNTISTLNHYILPFTDNEGLGVMWSLNGQNLEPIFNNMFQLRTQPKYANAIVAINVLDHLPFPITVNETTKAVTIDTQYAFYAADTNIAMIHIRGGVTQLTAFNKANKYTGFPSYSCSKMYMYPYSYHELIDFHGNRFIIRNEHLDTDALVVKVKGSISTTPKTAYIVNNYHGEVDNLDHGIINQTISNIPVVNNETAAYLQSQRNSERQGIVNNILLSSVAGGIRGSSAGGAGIVGGAIGGAVVGGFRVAPEVANIMAKRKDLANIPDNVSNQGNNMTFDIGWNYIGCWLVKRTVKPEYAKKLEDYFKRFGYKVNEIKMPNLKTRSKFNYVKTVGANIIGPVPQEDLAELRKIYDAGVTLWHTEIDHNINGNEVTS